VQADTYPVTPITASRLVGCGTKRHQGVVVISPYGLDIIESCLACKVRAERIFCDLPTSALQAFETIKYATAYPKGAVLFVEGQAPRGIFVLCKGRAKLSICGTDGKTLIVKLPNRAKSWDSGARFPASPTN